MGSFDLETEEDPELDITPTTNTVVLPLVPFSFPIVLLLATYSLEPVRP